MNEAAERIQTIENSLRCFAWGWSALIPFFGIPALVIALIRFRGIVPWVWNPAKSHAIAGLILATIGAVLSGLEFLLLGAAIVDIAF